MKDLDNLNTAIAGFRNVATTAEGMGHNICFIVGLPRVGSTLLHQVLISRYRLGYISNITGKFWKNPVAGAVLHQSLVEDDYTSNFLSEYGNTKGPFEPCEFGWFWKRVLDIDSEDETLGSNVDWVELNRTMEALSSVFQQPVIFDTPFVCGSISSLERHLDTVKVIYMTRDPWSVCNSILSARVKRYGKIDHFYGAKPKNWDEIKVVEDPVLQAVMQVHGLKKDIEEELLKVNPENIYRIDVSAVRQQPALIADEIAHFLGVSNPPRHVDFPTFFDRDHVPVFDVEYEVDFGRAWKSVFESV